MSKHARRQALGPGRVTRAARSIEDGVDVVGHWLTNRPTREVVRREVVKRAKRKLRDVGAAIARLLRVRIRKPTRSR